MAEVSSFAALSNGALLAETKHLAANERGSTVALILALSEVDSRRLYLSEGQSCMFYYCTVELHLSESAAYRRIEVARVARVFPQILEALKRGALNLTTALIIAPHLTPSNADALIAAASFKKKEDVRLLIARLHPKPNVPTVLRKQPEHRIAVATNGSGGLLAFEASAAQTDAPPSPFPPLTPMRPAAAVPPAVVAPLSATRYRIQFTAGQDTHDKLRQAQALLRHQVPSGDLDAIVNRALTLLIADVERKKLGLVTRPRARSAKPAEGSRHIPAAVRREVAKRDQGQCAFVGRRGRCSERALLEFHHVVPFAAGGMATVENIELRCRAHNAYEAVLFFGEEAVSRARPG